MPRISIRSLLLPLLAALTSGCLVYPDRHEVDILPALSGKVTRGGVPVSGLTLFMNSLQNRQDCVDPIATAETDAAGRYTFDQQTETANWAVLPLAPSSNTYDLSLCVAEGETLTPLYTASIFGAMPDALVLDCELGGPDIYGDFCVPEVTGYNGIRSKLSLAEIEALAGER